LGDAQSGEDAGGFPPEKLDISGEKKRMEVSSEESLIGSGFSRGLAASEQAGGFFAIFILNP
jgi:hypothetical protein